MENFSLSNHEKEILLKISRNALLSMFEIEKLLNITEKNNSDNLKCKCGVFISLYNKKMLRGCLGLFNPNKPLIDLVREMTRSTAVNDHRFKPVEKDELADICIEISVLTPMVKIKSIDEICLGKHGIYIKKGHCSGTFLPQVAEKTNWDIEAFLGHCSRDKAGIGWNGWKDAEIYTYEAIVFNETSHENSFSHRE